MAVMPTLKASLVVMAGGPAWASFEVRISGVGSYPPAIGEAITGILLWPAHCLQDTIKSDVGDDNNFSHD